MFEIKTIFIGDSSIGKTCLGCRMENDVFVENENNPTIAVQNMKYNYTEDNVSYKIIITDTAGQEIYNSLVTQVFRDQDVIVLCFASNDAQTFQNLKNHWFKLVDESREHENCLIIAETKNDIRREVTEQEINNFKDEINAEFVSTSAKQGDGITQLNSAIVRAFNKTNKQKKPIIEPIIRPRNDCC